MMNAMKHPTEVTGRRVVAYLIDTVPAFLIFVLAVRTFGEEVPPGTLTGNGINATWSYGGTQYLAQGGAAGRVFLVCTLYFVANLVVLQGLTGASTGKLVTGLRVVRPDGSPCGVGKAVVRWLVLVVDSAPYLFPLVGFVLIMSSDGNRRLGDMAADTYVVRMAAAGQPIALPRAGGYGYAAPHGYGPPAGPATPPVPDARWDAARNAWLRWDGSAWSQLDVASGRWTVLR